MDHVYLVSYSFDCQVILDDEFYCEENSGTNEEAVIKCFKDEKEAIMFAKQVADDLVESSTKKLGLEKKTPFTELDISEYKKSFRFSRFLDRDVFCETVLSLQRTYTKGFKDYNSMDSNYLYSESITVEKYFLFGHSSDFGVVNNEDT